MKKLLRITLITLLFLQAFIGAAFAKESKKDVPKGITIEWENINLKNGTYSFSLTLRTDKTLEFNNNLEISYMGIDGKYSLNYVIDETDDHLMTVTGSFDNIIVNSPLRSSISSDLINILLSPVSEDNYSYKLFLDTQKGFTFQNSMKFLFNKKPVAYSLSYKYDKTATKTKLLPGLKKLKLF